MIHGVTRNVCLTKRWAIKFPRMVLRGWLANRSEWKQRHRPHCNAPHFTIAYVISWYHRADEIWQDWESTPFLLPGLNGDEEKASSWGRFGKEWKLIDFDRCCEDPRGFIGAIYFGNQERLARKWMEPM